MESNASIAQKIWTQIIDISKKNSSTLLSLYFVTFFVYRDFGLKMSWGYIVLVFFLAINVIDALFIRKQLYVSYLKLPYLFLVLMIGLFFIMPSASQDKDSFAYIIMMLITLGFVMTASVTKKDIERTFKIIYYVALILSISIIFFQIFQDKYWLWVYPLLTPSAQYYAERHFFTGYSMSVGGIAYTLYLIVFAFFGQLAYVLYYPLSNQKKVLSYLSMVSLATVIVISGRRGELLSFIISLLLFLIISASKKQRRKRLKLMLIASILGMGLVIVLYPYLREVEALQRHILTIEVLFDLSDTGFSLKHMTAGRYELYQLAWDLFKEHPVFGVGFGQFSKISTEIRFSPEGTGLDTHNIILQLLSETGIVGTILILTPHIYIYYKIVKLNIYVFEYKREIDKSILFSSSTTLLLQTFFFLTSLVDPINFKVIFWVMFYMSFYLYIYSWNRLHSDSLECLVLDFSNPKTYRGS